VLVWQLPDVSWRDLGPRWSADSPWWLAGAALTTAAALTLAAARWHRVASAMADPPAFPRMLSHFLAGQFVSNVLPSAFGGDVVRVARLGNDLGSSSVAFATVTIDRMTGWLVLPLITLAALAAQPDLLDHGSASATALAVSLATLALLVTVLATAANRRLGAGAHTATGWRQFLGAVHLGVDALRRRPTAAAGLIGTGLAFQSLQCVSVWMAARAIGLDEVDLGAALAFFPVAAIIQNAPIGLGGLGVREGAFVLLFGAVGAPRGLSITLGLVVYGLTVATSAFGAPAFAFGGRRRRSPATTAPIGVDGPEGGPSS